jgi:hypothetical protein
VLSGDEGDRTPDLLNAIQALSQLSYIPNTEHFTDVLGGCQREGGGFRIDRLPGRWVRAGALDRAGRHMHNDPAGPAGTHRPRTEARE